MVRAAAKNWPHVGVVVDPADYAGVLAELNVERRRADRRDALSRCAQGVRAHRRLRRRDRQLADRARSRWRSARRFPDSFHFAGDKVQEMRYGENPHQSAAFYRDEAPAPGTHRHLPAAAGQGTLLQQHRRQRRRVGMRQDLRRARLRHRQARQSLRRGDRRGRRSTPTAARFATDPTSAFGGIIAFNRPVDAATVEAVSAQFVEVVIAPAYTADALAADREEGERARARSAAACVRRRGQRLGHEARRRRLAGAVARRAQRRRGRAQGRDDEGADARSR